MNNKAEEEIFEDGTVKGGFFIFTLLVSANCVGQPGVDQSCPPLTAGPRFVYPPNLICFYLLIFLL